MGLFKKKPAEVKAEAAKTAAAIAEEVKAKAAVVREAAANAAEAVKETVEQATVQQASATEEKAAEKAVPAEEAAAPAPEAQDTDAAPATNVETVTDTAGEAPAEEADPFGGMFHIIDHPLVQHKLTIMRQKDTGAKDFRELLEEIAMLVGYEVTRDLPLCDVEIETPITATIGKAIAGKKLAVVPILRAGLGMVDGLLRLVPAAKVGHIGLYRDPSTHEPVTYYCKLPDDIENRLVIISDPMLATGGSAIAAINMLKEKNCTDIRMMCLVAAPEGVTAVHKAHPDVHIFTAALDECLNEKAYIVPGLGDAGDRIFGTY